jgi:hypothetical protein
MNEWISCNFFLLLKLLWSTLFPPADSKESPLQYSNKVFYKQLPLKTSTVFIHYVWYSTSAYYYCPALLLGCPSLNYAITSNHHMVDYYFSMKFLFYLGKKWEISGWILFVVRIFLNNFAKFSGNFQQISDIVKSKNWNILCCLYEVLIQGWAVLSFSKKKLWGKGWVYGSLNSCSQKTQVVALNYYKNQFLLGVFIFQFCGFLEVWW